LFFQTSLSVVGKKTKGVVGMALYISSIYGWKLAGGRQMYPFMHALISHHFHQTM